MNTELPLHPTLFRFMHGLRSSVILDGVAIVTQAQSGNLSRKPVDKARQHLIRSAESVERAYLAGEITAQDVLLQGASHFENEKLIKYLSTVQEIHEPEPEDEENRDPDAMEEDDPDVDEREAVLRADEGLQDVDDDPWITTVWPSAASGNPILNFINNYNCIAKLRAFA